MDGFVIGLIPDEENIPTIYWREDETASEDLDNAQLFVDLVSARLAAGDIQKQYTTYDVQPLAASKGITLKKPYVAPSPISQS